MEGDENGEVRESEERGEEGVGTDASESEDEGMPSVVVALSFEGVLERLENPAEAVETLRKWAEYVGAPSGKEQHVVNGFCAKRDIHIDFFPGPDAGKLRTLERAENEMGLDADRHIYVGDTKRDEVIAEKAG
ncbi:MAG: hypothetical protein SV760_07215, partial [Halobacteria archaeon]|nr:hypothetical protein [Halobacteria archaeon]